MKLKIKPICLIIFGPQASGKGTQTQLLSKELKIPIISAGDIVKAARNRNDELGKRIARYYDNGKLIPDELVVKLLKEKINNLDLSKGIIFEGFPRRLKQIVLFENLIKDFNFNRVLAIYLKIKKETIIKRISKRKVCSKCNKPYKFNQRAYKSDICDICEAKLIVRPDDKEESLKRRLDIYYRNTIPVINEFRKQDQLLEIDGEPPIEPIHQDIINKLAQKGIIEK